MGEVSQHCHPHDVWLIIDGRVYDVSDFVEEHPGGVDAILRRPGQDNSEGFNGPQHPEKVHQLIGEYYIGTVRAEGEGGAGRQNTAKEAKGSGAEDGVQGDGDAGAASMLPPSGEGGHSASAKRRKSRKE